MPSCWNFCSRLRLRRQHSTPLINEKLQNNGLRVRQVVRKPAESELSNHSTYRRQDLVPSQDSQEANQMKESHSVLQSMKVPKQLPFNCSVSRVDEDEVDKALFSRESFKWLIQAAAAKQRRTSPFVVKHQGSLPKLVPITPLRRKKALLPSCAHEECQRPGIVVCSCDKHLCRKHYVEHAADEPTHFFVSAEQHQSIHQERIAKAKAKDSSESSESQSMAEVSIVNASSISSSHPGSERPSLVIEHSKHPKPKRKLDKEEEQSEDEQNSEEESQKEEESQEDKRGGSFEEEYREAMECFRSLTTPKRSCWEQLCRCFTQKHPCLLAYSTVFDARNSSHVKLLRTSCIILNLPTDECITASGDVSRQLLENLRNKGGLLLLFCLLHAASQYLDLRQALRVQSLGIAVFPALIKLAQAQVKRITQQTTTNQVFEDFSGALRQWLDPH